MTRRACPCGTILSRYNPSAYCSVCEPKLTTHAKYTLDHDPARIPERLNGEDSCIRGHDLNIHGRVRNAGGGRLSRMCRECDRIRQLERRAAAREAVIA